MSRQHKTLGRDELAALVVVEEAAQPLPWSRRQLEEELTHDDAVVRGAFADDAERLTLVGYASWRKNVHELWLLNLAVLPAWRRRGVGRALLDEGEALAHERGASELWLEVRASNAGARLLYEAAGFVEAGQRLAYYRPLVDGGVREDAVLMRRTIA